MLGTLVVLQGHLIDGQLYLEESLRLGRELGDHHLLPRVQLGLAALLCHQGDAKTAVALCREGFGFALASADDTAVQLAFDGLARIASLEGRVERAARLLGVADVRYEAMGVHWPRSPYAPPPTHYQFVAHLREVLSDQAFAQLTSEGRGWSQSRAIAYALETSWT
jgi:hypothetical protein